MKSLLLCFFLSFLSASLGAQSISQSDKATDTTEVTVTKSIGEKSPELAFVLSLIFPGAGQYYNGEAGKGLFQETFIIIGAAMIVLGGKEIRSRGPYAYSYGEGSPELKTAGIIIVAGTWFWSIADAPLAAEKKNKEARQDHYGHFLEFEKGQNVIGIDLGYIGNSFGSKVTYHF